MPEDISKSRPDSTGSATTEKSRRRSERVVLRIPLQLSAQMPDGKRICIEVYTLVVNAHGGLLDMGIEMVAGQKVLLSNSKTENANTGKVLRVEKSEEGPYSVAFEFEFPSPNFWPISFPPSDWACAASTS
jgi:hypothetical protein